MRLMLGVLMACSIAVAGIAATDEVATDAKTKVAEKKECPAAKKAKATVEGKKQCPSARKVKGMGCPACVKFLGEAKALREAGVKMELQAADNGHVVVATADSQELVDKVRALSVSHVAMLTGLSRKAGKTTCGKCASFAKALKAGNITVERVEIDGGVKMVYTAKTDEAKDTLKNCCCASWGLKEQGKDKAACPKKAEEKP